MEAKDFIAFGLLLLAVPTCIAICCFSQRARDAAFFLMVAGTAITDRLDVNFFGVDWYRGTTRGLEFSFVDVMAFGVLFSSILFPRKGESRIYWPAGLGFMLLFLFYALASVISFEPRIYGVFEISKMLRGLLFFLAAALFVRSERQLVIFVAALCCIMLFEGALSVKQRWLDGINRIPGSLDHENSFSMYLCMVSPVFVAAANAALPQWLRRLSLVVIPITAFCILLTISRAGVPIYVLVMAGAAAFCISWRITLKKLAVAAVVVMAMAALFYKAWDSLKERYGEASLEEEYLDPHAEGRGYYLRLARVIMEDRFFGFGLNNWSYWVSKKYGVMVGRPYDDYDRVRGRPDDEIVEGMVFAAPAHNLAALTVGELGIPGLLLLALLWARWFLMGTGFLLKRNAAAMHRIGVGIFFGVCGVFLQSITEWVFRQTHIFLTFNILIGVLAALCYAKQRERRKLAKNSATDQFHTLQSVELPACSLPTAETAERPTTSVES